MEKLSREKVDNLFSQRVAAQPDINSVLDAAISKQAHRANVLHDYYSKRYLKKYLDPQKNDSILDFGCGIGRLSFFLSPYVKNIVGIDPVKEMIEVALKNNAKKNISFLLLNKSADLPKDTFDKIFTNWVLAHVDDFELNNYVSWFFKLLKPGGRLVIFEQVEGIEEKESEAYKRRKSQTYVETFEKHNFILEKQKKVYRFPSYSRAIWNKFNFSNRLLLPFFYLIEVLTIKRKPNEAAYFTEAFVFYKPKE